MSKSLVEFIEFQKDKLERFEKYWRKNNKKNPEMFPFKFEKDNVGMWQEQFDLFEES